MSTQICRGFTDDQWRGLKKRLIQNSVVQNDEAAWGCAIKVFDQRITERFLSCIEALQQADSRADVEVAIGAPPDCSTLPKDHDKNIVVPGFAIMALCCLLIETLESFRGGKPTSFLQRPSFGEAFTDDEVAKNFVKGIRQGILHDAETRHWVIWREEPTDRIVEHEGNRYSLNRTAFYQALRQEFEAYLADLRDSQRADLRKRFIKENG